MPTERTRLTVLVAGGAGFLGSHLCDRLIAAGHRVICVDNLDTGRYRNVRPLANHPAFRFIEHDIVEPLTVAGRIDRIYNLACPASPPHYQRDAIATLKTCVVGTLNLLDLAERKGARLLQASTSEVYGDPEVHPQREAYRGAVSTTGPRACYDEGKRAAETACFDYARQHGVEIKVARIFNTYGPRMLEDDGRVVSNFIVQALRDAPLTIYGDGRQTRSFCFVSDLVRGLEALMESAPEITGPVNLGNPHEIPVTELAEMVLERIATSATIRHLPLPQDDPRRRRPDISLASELLDWRPEVALADGLQATIDDFLLRRIEIAGHVSGDAAAPARGSLDAQTV